MTERFSAPGATLVKLLGRPDQEESQFGERAGRVAEIGVRTAMRQSVFLTALSLVSALALARTAISSTTRSGRTCASPGRTPPTATSGTLCAKPGWAT